MYLTAKENILTDTSLEEMTDDIPEELTVQVHIVHENATATKSRLEEIKEKTAKYPGLKKVMKCRIIAKKQRKHGK